MSYKTVDNCLGKNRFVGVRRVTGSVAGREFYFNGIQTLSKEYRIDKKIIIAGIESGEETEGFIFRYCEYVKPNRKKKQFYTSTDDYVRDFNREMDEDIKLMESGPSMASLLNGC